MKLSTSIVTKAVAYLLMLALAVTTQVVNGEKIIVNCRVIIPYFLLSVMSIASFLFDTHPNIILHASCLLLFKPSQLKIHVNRIAIVHSCIPAAVQPMSLCTWASAIRIKPWKPNVGKNMMAVGISVWLLRTLTLTLTEPL
jgi:hypothetical protein